MGEVVVVAMIMSPYFDFKWISSGTWTCLCLCYRQLPFSLAFGVVHFFPCLQLSMYRECTLSHCAVHASFLPRNMGYLSHELASILSPLFIPQISSTPLSSQLSLLCPNIPLLTLHNKLVPSPLAFFHFTFPLVSPVPPNPLLFGPF